MYLVGSSDDGAKVQAMSMLLGTMAFNATIADSSTQLLEMDDTGIYLNCQGACQEITSSGGSLIEKGGIFKLGLENGEPLWAADVPVDGLVVANDALYVNFASEDATFQPWGGKDHYFAKFDAESGRGRWILQAGGAGAESAGHLAADDNGDIYAIGSTTSSPAYFDPLEIDHTGDYVVKLKASDENFPKCRNSNGGNTPGSFGGGGGNMAILPGFCYISNICYEDGAASRSTDCSFCDSSTSQTSFTPATNCTRRLLRAAKPNDPSPFDRFFTWLSNLFS